MVNPWGNKILNYPKWAISLGSNQEVRPEIPEISYNRQDSQTSKEKKYIARIHNDFCGT